MRTRNLVIALLVAVAVFVVIIGVVVGPTDYKATRGGEDRSITHIEAGEAEAAVGELDGVWTVMPGDEPNRTIAGYSDDEILRGEPVTVVGSTEQVSGQVEISESALTSAEFETRKDGVTTDGNSATLLMRVDLTVKGFTVPKTVEVTVLRSGE